MSSRGVLSAARFVRRRSMLLLAGLSLGWLLWPMTGHDASGALPALPALPGVPASPLRSVTLRPDFRSAVRGCEALTLKDGTIIVVGGDEEERYMAVVPVDRAGTEVKVECRAQPAAYAAYPTITPTRVTPPPRGP